MSEGRVAGVLLAAGRSARLGRPKQLLDLGGRPLLRRTLDQALASLLDPVIVVLGHEAAAILMALGDHSALVVVNERFADGQATSLAAGIAALPDGLDAAMVLLGDQPGVGPDVIDAVVAAWRESRPPIAMPEYGGTLGNPVLFRSDLFPALLALRGDEGARSLVRARQPEVLMVPVPYPSPPPDVDTDADYSALQSWWANRRPPRTLDPS